MQYLLPKPNISLLKKNKLTNLITIVIISYFIFVCKSKPEKPKDAIPPTKAEYKPSQKELNIIAKLSKKYPMINPKDIYGNPYNKIGFEILSSHNNCWIRLSNLDIDSLPQEIYGLENVKFIDLNKVNIKKIPDLSRFKDLESFQISHIKIGEELILDDNVKKLDRLSVIGCDVKKIKITSKLNVFMIRLFDNNNLQEFSYQKGFLDELKDFRIRQNNLKPIDLDNMPKLNYFGICTSSIKEDTSAIKQKYKNVIFSFQECKGSIL